MYFEATIKRNDDSKGKEVTDRFIVGGAGLFGEVEATMLMKHDNECEVVAIKRSAVVEIVNSRTDEREDIYYATLESYYMSDAGEEKSSKSVVAVFATDMTDAKGKLDSYMEQGLSDMAIAKIAKTRFLDVIDYIDTEQ